jgi:MFS family permease
MGSLPSLTSADTPDRSRVGAGFILFYALAYTALWLALITPVAITVALRIEQIAPHDAATQTSHVLSIGALLAMLSNPICGHLSDRTRSRFGRRRPWLIAGAAVGFVALWLTGVAQSIGGVLVSWCLAQVAFNAVLAALIAVLPDQVPPQQRGTVSGILGVCMPIGQIAGTFLVQQLAGNLLQAFIVPAAIGLVTIVAFALTLADRPLDADTHLDGDRDLASRFWLAPVFDADFACAWLSRVCFVIGTVMLCIYQPFLLLNDLRVSVSDLPRLVFQSTLVQSAAIVLSSVVAGRISDALGRRKPFVFAGALVFGAGMWMIAAADSLSEYLVAIAVTGVGNGIFVSVDLALMTQVLPDRLRHAAKDLGVVNITNTLPQVIAPAVTPAVLGLTHGGYAMLFALAGGLALSGSLFLLRIKRVR